MKVLLAVDGSEPSLACVARIRLGPTVFELPLQSSFASVRASPRRRPALPEPGPNGPASRDERCFRPTEGQANHRERSERRSTMLPRLVLAAFLLGHAAIHAGYLSPRPAATVGGPPWPFDLTHIPDPVPARRRLRDAPRPRLRAVRARPSRRSPWLPSPRSASSRQACGAGRPSSVRRRHWRCRSSSSIRGWRSGSRSTCSPCGPCWSIGWTPTDTPYAVTGPEDHPSGPLATRVGSSGTVGRRRGRTI